jgi:hypothetical protein
LPINEIGIEMKELGEKEIRVWGLGDLGVRGKNS